MCFAVSVDFLDPWGGVPAREVPAQGGVPAQGVYLPGGVPACGEGVYLPGGYLPGGVPARGVYLPRGVYLHVGRGCICPGGCTMWPIPSCIWCYLYAASSPTETHQHCSCLYSAGWSCDLQGILGYTPPPVNRITHTCKNITLPQLCCGR